MSRKNGTNPSQLKGQSTRRVSMADNKVSTNEIHASADKLPWKASAQDNNAIWNDLLLSKSYETSHWQLLSTHIMNRKEKWFSRNQDIMSDVSTGKKAMENRHTCVPSSLPEVKLPAPPAVSPNEQSRALKDLDVAVFKHSLYCFYCWDVVPVGSSRLACRSCSSIAHANCHENNITKNQSCNENETHEFYPLHVSKASVWQCPECKDEIDVTSKYFRSKHELNVSLFAQAKATMLVQRFCRMMVHRIRFKKLIIGVVSLQRIFRNIRSRMRDAMNNIQKLRPFRIRLHTIRGLIHESSSALIDDVNEMPIALPEVIFFGDIKSSTYDINFGYSSRNNSQSDVNRSVETIDEISDVSRKESSSQSIKLEKLNLSQSYASPSISPNLSPKKGSVSHHTDQLNPIRRVSQPTSPNRSQINKQQVNLMELFRQGCTYQPNYALPSKTVQLYPSGQMMLTIGIYSLKSHHATSGQDKSAQISFDTSESSYKYSLLHRIDIPLKKTLKSEKLTIPMLQACGIDTSELSVATLEKLLTEYSYSEFSPSRSYVLFPACSAQIIVKMFLSQVTDWPQATIVGKLSKNIKESLIWKRTASYQYSLSDCLWIDVPASDEYNKMVLHVRRPKVSKASSSTTKKSKKTNSNINVISRLADSTISSTSNQKSMAIKHEKGLYYANALVTWSVIPFNDDGENVAGMIEIRSMVS
jgi:hypothetical protein